MPAKDAASLNPGLDRYRAIDGLRFMAAIGIVLRHYAHFSDNRIWDMLFAKSYLFVDLFFVISGFVITQAYAGAMQSSGDYRAFLQNRLARIYPLHLLMFLAFLAIDVAAWTHLYAPHAPHVYSPIQIVGNLLLVHAWGVTDGIWYNYPSWSISAEWMLYLLFPVVLLVLRRGGAIALLALAALAMAALELLNETGHLPSWTRWTYEFGFLRAVPTFLIGAALCSCVGQSALVFRSLAWPAGFFLAAVAAMLLQSNDCIIIALFVLTIASATGAELAGARGVLTGPVMGRLGDCSYAVYMVHLLLGLALVQGIGGRLLHLRGSALDVYILACVVVLTGIAALVYQYLELPARRFFRHRAVARTNPAQTITTLPNAG